MSITRRNVTIGGMSLLAGTSMSTRGHAELGELLGIGEGLEDFALATDAYIFGYPLVTMEMTRRVITNVAAPVGTRGADGPDHQAAPISRCVVPGRDRAECRHALHHLVLRRRQGAVGAQHPRHEGPLRPVSDAGRLDHRVPGAGQADHRHRRADLCDHRPGMEGHAAGRRQGVQVADQHRVAARPHLLHRHAGGLRRGAQAAGRVQAGAAEFLRQTLHAAAPARSIRRST